MPKLPKLYRNYNKAIVKLAEINRRILRRFWQAILVKAYIQALLNSSESDSKKNGRQLEKIMLTTDKWNFLQELIYILGPFEEATQHLGGEKYVTHSIMHPILKEIKRLLLLPPSTSSTPSTPSTPST